MGIIVPPAEFRLIPKPEDPYRWRYLPEKSHFFKKNLSKHTLMGYREICASANVSFEAVHLDPSNQISLDMTSFSSPRASSSIPLIDFSFTPLVEVDTSLDVTFRKQRVNHYRKQ